MSSYGLAVAVLLACILTLATAQSSCKDRCGMGYYRGYTCQCDYSCLVYGECCRDYELLCTTKNSCKGRCGETFKRGRPCNCDDECVKYNQCCPDYADHCNEDPIPKATEQPVEDPLTLSEGDDPGDDLFPTVNPTSYPQDDPNNDPKQVFSDSEVNAPPDPSPLPEGSSGSPPTDLLESLTTVPPLPDLDGFEVIPEPVTVSAETTTALSTDGTTPGSTTAASSTAQSTVSTDGDTTAPESTTAVNTVSTLLTSDPTTVVTELQTEPPQTADDITMTPAPDVTTPAPDVTTLPPDITSTTQETTEEPLQTADDIIVTPAPDMMTLAPDVTTPAPDVTTLPPDITSTTQETTEETTTHQNLPSTTPENVEPSTIVPDEETTTTPAMTTTDLPNPTTSTTAEATSVISTVATTNADLEVTTTKEPDVTQSTTSTVTSKPTEKPRPVKPFRPVLSPEHKPVLNGLGVDPDYQADDSNDTNLCSGRPISGVTTLSNGTVVVFRGHFFWVLDRNKVPGPARGITQVWGIPSPIDTVFTRCNCQGKTYIFKGPQYWRYENDALDPGFPKVVQTGFDGLKGHITAALSVPQYNQRRESVYFFKRGGTVQKYSYQFGTNPSCGRKVHYAIYTNRNRIARQVPAQVSLLEPAINYRTSWRGFPTTITAAVSIPNKREPEGYNYYVFSRSKSYRIRMNGERPVVTASKSNTSPHSNEVFKCPKKTSQSQ